MVKILYDNVDVFSGISPTPFVGLTSENIFYANRWGTRLSITLNGTITGVCGSFQSLISGQKKLISGFSKDYRNLSIQENGTEIFANNVLQIRNINFSESRYYGFLPYSINIDAYDSGKYWQYFGVLDPKRECSVNENDGEIEISYSLSARGFNTNDQNNGLENAQNWVNQYTGLNNSILSGFCFSGYNVDCLVSRTENVNRINNTYSIEEKYRGNTGDISGILKYTVEVSEDADNFTTVSVKGEISRCLTGTIDGARALYASINVYDIASGAFYDATLQTNLNPIAIKSGITEDKKKLSFDITFNDDPRPNVYFDGNIVFKTDEVKEVTTVSIDGDIKCRYGDIPTKYAACYSFYQGTDWFNFLVEQYEAQGFTYDLNTVWLNRNTAFDEKNGKIKLRWETSDRISDMNVNWNVVPSHPYIVAIPILNGSYVLQDYGFKEFGQIGVRISYPAHEAGTALSIVNGLAGERTIEKTVETANEGLSSASKTVKSKTPTVNG